TQRAYPTSQAYLGIACLVLVSRQPLTPYYVLNIGDERIELTGVIEMTNLVDRVHETHGLSLIYVPKYLDSHDPELDEPDDALRERLIERGLRRLFRDFDRDALLYAGVHRARYVQPLPLVRTRDQAPTGGEAPALARPFQILNTSMLTCATLN